MFSESTCGGCLARTLTLSALLLLAHYEVSEVHGLAMGSSHTCVLLDDDSVKCFGLNTNGQLGLGDTDARNTAGTLGDNLDAVNLGSGKVVDMSAGNEHTCVVFSDGRLKCFGKNDKGQLGLGDTESRGDEELEMGNLLPEVDLGENRTALSVAADGDRTCALLDTGNVRCWGDGEFGALGSGGEGNAGDGGYDIPDFVNIGGDVVSTVGEGPCVVTDEGVVKCWGKGYYGKNGQGDDENIGDESGEMGLALGSVPLGTGASAYRAAGGRDYVCAILVGGSIKCWGRGEGGQLGTESILTLGDDPSELGDALGAVNLGSGVTSVDVTAGQQHTCALLDTGAVKCWGKNFYGNLGIGNFRARGHFPGTMGDGLPEVDLGTGRLVLMVRAKEERTCAILDNGSLKCWGYNGGGELGLGDTNPRGLSPSEMGDNLPAVNLGTNRTAVALSSADLPTLPPTLPPTSSPTSSPTDSPTLPPTSSPTVSPTAAPTTAPTAVLTAAPSVPVTQPPTPMETPAPTLATTPVPSPAPRAVTPVPLALPTAGPEVTLAPSATLAPSGARASVGTRAPVGTAEPSAASDGGDGEDDTATIIASIAAPLGILCLLGGLFLLWRRRLLIPESAAAVGAKSEGPDGPSQFSNRPERQVV